MEGQYQFLHHFEIMVETIVGGYLQGNQYSRVPYMEQDFVHPQLFATHPMVVRVLWPICAEAPALARSGADAVPESGRSRLGAKGLAGLRR